MDPRQQQPSRPQQRTPYISDFVSTPRSQSSAPQPTGATGAATNVSTASTSASAASSATPVISTPQTTDTAQPSPTPQLARSSPASSATPRSVQAAPVSTDVTTASTSRTQHKSFALPEVPDIEPHETKVPKPHQGLRDILSIFGVLASALALAFCLISFVFQSYQVDGPSMQATLQNNDHLIVWKVPKTIAKLTGKAYIPNRGDVIIFNEPGSAVGGTDKQLIKRVIGLPGERVTVKDDDVTVYNKTYPNGFSPDRTLPYGNVIKSSPGNVDVTLKEGQVFAMGDNRTNSLDSRVFGPVNSSQIVGKLVLRVLPLNTVKKF